MTPKLAKTWFDYCPKTGLLRWKNKSGVRSGSIAGRPDREGYTVVRIRNQITGKRQEFRAHRLAWMIQTDEAAPPLIDHIDGDRSNNAWSNLRPASRSENMANGGPTRRSKTGFRGVSKTRHGTYQAAVRCRGKDYYLGCHKTAEAAARAYDAKAAEVFGPYARLNFPSNFKPL